MIHDVRNTIGLKSQQVENIRQVFLRYPHVDKVLIYGSRALGNYRKASDIDLAIKGENLNSNDEMKITFDLDDLMLPYKFDITMYNRVNNQELRYHIDQFGKVIYKKQAMQP